MSQAQEDPFCLECHWEAFHLDNRALVDSPSKDNASHIQWDCTDHNTALDYCDLEEACCDFEDCTFKCDSICDGFLECDASTACSISHCEDTHCKSPGPVCFDEHCFEDHDGNNTGHDTNDSNPNADDHALESLLGLGAPLTLDANDLLAASTANVPPSEAIASAAKATADGHHATDFLPVVSSTLSAHQQCSHGHYVSHPVGCHGFPKEFDNRDGNPAAPSYNDPTNVNPAEVFHMLGMCTDFSTCHSFHVPEDHQCSASLNKPEDDSSTPAPFACLHPPSFHHLHHHHVKDTTDTTTTTTTTTTSTTSTPNTHETGTSTPVRGVCRSHHRCRTHMHAHPHPYSSHPRHSRSSVSSHLISSPSETPPPLDSRASSILASPSFPPDDIDVHICKWTNVVHGIKSACGATFSDAGALQDHLISSHMMTMDGAKGNGYYCRWDGCHRPDEPFSQKSKLQGHFLTHSNYKNFKCTVCGKFFARQATLDRHERSHRGEKPYKCRECGKSFTDSSELKTHMRTHTGEKPFKCTYPGCNFETGDSSNMSSHRLTHGERKHKCHFPGCNKSFTRPDQLKRHLKTTHKYDAPGLISPSPLSPLSPLGDQLPLAPFSAIS
ncbi:hypothetical protein ASPZODRAFT_128145 [Penicilliopsis zonata CBS 506.65]|uniref:C2H2-type domain-containing protein n=1 Tax=Penicilliopsis zonata CBS 506.65 TaxID=1073090 RepID=A0A1L9SRB1_9EURO|nr:hypothetical protein ASPZODRAFT_128145 [Penicilliopsis zonata CBS 506.65]OJJ49654.1 hypothetical protein ASPZODRAFT_128145 [Penicilliopsis zonata CBS 506.65]